jgi:hypothetical protein
MRWHSRHQIPSVSSPLAKSAMRGSRHALRFICFIAFLFVLPALDGQSDLRTAVQENALPYWAHPVLGPGETVPPGTPDDGTLRHLPNSMAAFTITQIANRFDIADWFPVTHPSMPTIVSHGDKSAAVQACAFCHLPNGQGHPQNASLAGFTPSIYAGADCGF